MLTMNGSTTMPSTQHASRGGNAQPSAGLMLTSRMGRPRKQSKTSPKALASSPNTLKPVGQKPSTLPCGPMHYGLW